VNVTSSALCPVRGFGTFDVEPLGSSIIAILIFLVCELFR
jgi:hypothetical protein